MRQMMEDYLLVAAEYTRWLQLEVNNRCEAYEAWQLISMSILTCLVLRYIHDFFADSPLPVSKRIKLTFFRYIRFIPQVQAYVDKQMQGPLKEFSARKLYKLKPDMTYMNKLPKRSRNQEEVAKMIDEYLSLDKVKWEQGKVSGAVYNGGKELTEIVCDTYKKFAWSNPLHPDVFPSCRKMEAEIVRMTCTLFNGDPDVTCGCVSSGGTESILLACKAYRQWAHERGIRKPEMIVAESAHAAFDKAAICFQMKIVHVPVDKQTRQVDVAAMRRAINRNTCMLVGSTPQFPHGAIDPIAEIGALGKRYGIPVHVDACLGGFLIPFMDAAGFPLDPFDFRVDGVTSISADTHKYGYAPKGTSVLMYSDTEWLHRQYFVCPDWQGGIYATPMFGGSRSGAVVAACWSAMVHYGFNGYVESTRKIVKTTRLIEERLRKIKGIFIFGSADVSVVAIGSDIFDVYRLSSALTELGWNLNSLQYPASVHICVTLVHTQHGVADRFISDVTKSVREIMKRPQAKTTGAGAMYGMAAGVPDRSVIGDLTMAYLDAFYDTK